MKTPQSGKRRVPMTTISKCSIAICLIGLSFVGSAKAAPLSPDTLCTWTVENITLSSSVDAVTEEFKARGFQEIPKNPREQWASQSAGATSIRLSKPGSGVATSTVSFTHYPRGAQLVYNRTDRSISRTAAWQSWPTAPDIAAAVDRYCGPAQAAANGLCQVADTRINLWLEQPDPATGNVCKLSFSAMNGNVRLVFETLAPKTDARGVKTKGRGY